MIAQDTVIAAVNKSVANSPFQEGMIFHLDRGVQYAAKVTANTLKSDNMIPSMSRKANCLDNAVSESFFKSLKTESLYGSKLMGKNK